MSLKSLLNRKRREDDEPVDNAEDYTDDSVEDNDYLNQMLQNNMYYITTMSEDSD